GFLLYWMVATPWSATIGIFLLGLFIAPMFPMSMALALGAARDANDMASVRLMLGQGLAILLAPAGLGALADAVGMHSAHLVVLVLGLAALAAFLTAQTLERRPQATVTA